MTFGKVLYHVNRCIRSFPNDFTYAIRRSKNFITNFTQVVIFIIINRNKYHPILSQQRTSHHQARINHRAPIRMVSTIRIRIFDKAITQFIHISSKQVFLRLRTGKIIMIHKVIPRIIRRVDIYHLHLTEIRLLEQFQHFEVVALNIEVLRSVPIHAILLDRTERLVDRAQHFGTSRLLAHPVELVGLRSILNGIIAQQLAQDVKVNNSFYPPDLGSAASVKHEGAI